MGRSHNRQANDPIGESSTIAEEISPVVQPERREKIDYELKTIIRAYPEDFSRIYADFQEFKNKYI